MKSTLVKQVTIGILASTLNAYLVTNMLVAPNSQYFSNIILLLIVWFGVMPTLLFSVGIYRINHSAKEGNVSFAEYLSTTHYYSASAQEIVTQYILQRKFLFYLVSFLPALYLYIALPAGTLISLFRRHKTRKYFLVY